MQCIKVHFNVLLKVHVYRLRQRYFQFVFSDANQRIAVMSAMRNCAWSVLRCVKPFLENFPPFNELFNNKGPFKLVITALSKMCCCHSELAAAAIYSCRNGWPLDNARAILRPQIYLHVVSMCV